MRTEQEIMATWQRDYSSPMVSICCITYNHEPFIKDTLKGFLIQETDFPFEILIHDDASTDGTAEIIRKYEDRYPNLIKPIYQTVNQYSQGVNVGKNNSKRAKGKYIAFCEGDDCWIDSYKLQKQLDFLEKNPDYGLISTDIYLIDAEGKHLNDNQGVLRQREQRKPEVDFFDLLRNNLINTLTVCARADLVKQIVCQAEMEDYWFTYDYWYWLNIASVSRIRLSYEKTAAYRIHPGGISHQSEFFLFRAPIVRVYATYFYFRKVSLVDLKKKARLLFVLCKIIIKLIVNRRFTILRKIFFP